MPTATVNVLVADSDDDRRRWTMKELKKRERLHVEGVKTVRTAMQVLDATEIDCVVSSPRLADGIATSVFRYAAQKTPETGRVFLTEGDPDPLVLQATEIAFGHVDLESNQPYEKLGDLVLGGYDYNAYAPYPVPVDEDKRLDAVEKYRDKVTNRLRALVDTAAADFDVDKTSIRFITRDKQEYAACHGFIAPDIDRKDAICTHTIMDDKTVEITNVQDHPLFKDVDVFKAMDIDWYAGAVIQIEGQNIGTFCLEDAEQQVLSPRERKRLQDYAAHAAALLALEEALENPEIHTVEEAVGQAQTKA